MCGKEMTIESPPCFGHSELATRDSQRACRARAERKSLGWPGRARLDQRPCWARLRVAGCGSLCSRQLPARLLAPTPSAARQACQGGRAGAPGQRPPPGRQHLSAVSSAARRASGSRLVWPSPTSTEAAAAPGSPGPLVGPSRSRRSEGPSPLQARRKPGSRARAPSPSISVQHPVPPPSAGRLWVFLLEMVKGETRGAALSFRCCAPVERNEPPPQSQR